MRTKLTILAFGLCAAIWLAAQSDLQEPAFIGALNVSATAAPTYLVTEGAEGVGTPSGWTNFGTVDWDEAGTVNQGSESLQLDSSAGDSRVSVGFTAQSELWGFFALYPDHIPSTDAKILRIMNAGTELGTLSQRGNGRLRIDQLGGTSAFTTLTMGEDSWVYIWWYWKTGTGADNVFSVWWSTDTTKPGEGDAQYYASSSNGTNQLTVGNVFHYSDFIGTVNGSRYFDYMRVDDVVIGSAP